MYYKNNKIKNHFNSLLESKIEQIIKQILKENNEPDNLKYAPLKCKSIDDIKKGLINLHTGFPNRKKNMMVDIKIQAYQLVADKLGIKFDAYTFFDSLKN